MKVHEYQALALFKEYGIKVVDSELADSPDKAFQIAKELGSQVAIKAQVLVGGRGKAGGVKLADSPQEAQAKAKEILSLTIKTLPVEKVLVAKGIKIAKEYYLGIAVDRSKKEMVLILSSSGGVEIEKLAGEHPEKIDQLSIRPSLGIDENSLEQITDKVFKNPDSSKKAADTILKMYQLFIDKDCSLVEINPYVETESGDFFALDAKINFDDNSLFKHQEIKALACPEEYSLQEKKAKEFGLSFVSLEGDIGCIVNGAGLAMATMDLIELFGRKAANFLDVGGSSNPDKVIKALKIILSNPKVKAILINIFGGITRCDDIAQGIIMALDQIDIKVPLVIRLIGTNETEGRALLKNAGLTAAEGMTEAVKKVIELA
jgi:succinyl-CoA synthetase beta subunit